MNDSKSKNASSARQVGQTALHEQSVPEGWLMQTSSAEEILFHPFDSGELAGSALPTHNKPRVQVFAAIGSDRGRASHRDDSKAQDLD